MDTNIFVYSEQTKTWKPQDLHRIELKALVKETLRSARQSNAFNIKCTANSKFNNEKAENENNKLFSARKITDVTNLLTASDKMLKKFPEELDAENDAVATKSEIVIASTLKSRTRKPTDFVTCMTTADYVSSAGCPRFLRFLNDVFKQNESQNAMIEALQIILGYSFTGSNSGEHVFCHIGGGSNGKSTLFEVLLDIAGSYGETMNGDFLTLPAAGSRGGYQTHMPLDRILYRIAGKRFIIVDDLKDENRVWNEEVIKAVTGTKISIRPEYEKARTVPNRVKLHIGMNGFPRVEADNYAMKRRFYLIPYKREFTPDAVYKQKLMKALYAEKDGIFTWIMQGANKWVNQGLPSVDEMNQFADETFMNSLNVMDETLYTENFQAIKVDPDALEDYAGYTPARELYNFYLKRVKEMRVQSYDDMIKFGIKLGKYFKVKPVRKKFKGQSVSWWPIRAKHMDDENDL
jgi:P4 family phage/plasmid primase-like protien